MVDEALRAFDTEFDTLYAELGRDSIPPEKLLRGNRSIDDATSPTQRYLISKNCPRTVLAIATG